MAGKPKTIDEYLEALSDDKRAALEKLRKTIKAAAPDAEECISYQLAAFRQDGMLVAFGATANHCAFYPMSSSTVESYKNELKDYDTSKGTIRFQADKPLPAALVRKLVKTRLAENLVQNKKVKAPQKAVRKRDARVRSSDQQTDPAVVAFLRELDHPLKREIEAVRDIILGASPEIREGIKWNAPSFRTTEYFATFNLRAKDGVQLIFHTGAKVKETAKTGVQVADPKGLLNWLAKDRCMVTIGVKKDVDAKRAALRDIVIEWIRYV
jgi:uncharacterized protein YdhG (YjbR/CyaY superfamily)